MQSLECLSVRLLDLLACCRNSNSLSLSVSACRCRDVLLCVGAVALSVGFLVVFVSVSSLGGSDFGMSICIVWHTPTMMVVVVAFMVLPPMLNLGSLPCRSESSESSRPPGSQSPLSGMLAF